MQRPDREMTRYVRRARAVAVVLVGGLFWCPVSLSAGGVCILHPRPFKLQSDTVRWSFTITPGAQCIQGLRWSTLIVDKISIVEAPKSGRLVLSGPSFRYLADVAERGSDQFKIAVSGSSLRIDGTSTIDVDVNLR